MNPHSSDFDDRSRALATWARTYSAAMRGRVAADDQLDALRTRSASDAKAAWLRWHVPEVADQFDVDEVYWYELFERARVETLASRHMKGMATNLGASVRDSSWANEAVPFVLDRTARLVFSGQADISEVTRLLDLGVPNVQSYKRGWLARIIPYGKRGRREFPQVNWIRARLIEAEHHLEDPVRFARELASLVSCLAQLVRNDLNRNSPGREKSPIDFSVGGEEETEAEELEQETLESERRATTIEVNSDSAGLEYRVLTTEWDEIQPAAYWLKPEDADLLQNLLTIDRRAMRQLAHRLQRRLQSARLQRWQFDQEEGVIDSRRLAQLVGGQANSRVFRQEDRTMVPEACVCFLVDQSGSMRGERQRMAAMTIDLAVHTLELCDIQCEVLGFTTCYKGDNPVSSHILSGGAPKIPGRMNAIRHIAYKHADQPWRRMRPTLGLMLREDFGNENIDGEALRWAASRLICRPEPRRILLTLSDGAPYDEATVKANGRIYLESHLRKVISEIDRSPLQLAAIGIGSDVSRFYRRAIRVRDPGALAQTLFGELADLLVPAGKGL